MNDLAEPVAPTAEDRNERLSTTQPPLDSTLRPFLEKLVSADSFRGVTRLADRWYCHTFGSFLPLPLDVPCPPLNPLAQCALGEPYHGYVLLQSRRAVRCAKARQRLVARRPETARERRMARRRRRGW